MTSALQVVPHDVPPFANIARGYVAACNSVGIDCATVFLSRPNDEPVAGAHYLRQDKLSDTNALGRALERYCANQDPVDLLINHRYRSWRASDNARVTAGCKVVVAHEFGLLDRWQRRLRARRARDTIFAGVSDPVTAELAQTARRTLTLPNPIRLEDQTTLVEREVARTQLGLDPDTFVVAVVGRIHPKKRPQLALDGFAALTEEDARLVFVGEGELPPCDDTRVRHLGFVANAPQLMRAFDALLLCSASVEAFGMVALEAMLAGVPVVCADVSGPRYVLGPLGHYFSDAHQIAQRLRQVRHIDRSQYLDDARARVAEHFSEQALGRRLSKLLA